MLPQCLHPDGMQSVCQSFQGLPVRLESSARLRWSQIDESCFIPSESGHQGPSTFVWEILCGIRSHGPQDAWCPLPPSTNIPNYCENQKHPLLTRTPEHIASIVFFEWLQQPEFPSRLYCLVTFASLGFLIYRMGAQRKFNSSSYLKGHLAQCLIR